jgi:hypothetical protein
VKPTLVDLGAALPLNPGGDGVFDLEVPTGWQQGRGAFGGLVVGTLARGMESLEPPTERPIRTLDATLGGPLRPGAAELRVALRRRGQAMTTLAAQILQGGTVVAEAMAICGLARPGSVARGLLLPPTPTPWAEVPVVEVGPPLAPDFARHFEFRNLGAAPFTGGQAGGMAAGWIRPRVETRRHDTLELVSITDAWWPAALAAESMPRPMSTVAFHWSCYGTPTDDAPLYHEGRVLASDEGFFTEERILWDADGKLIAVNHQTFAVS